MMTAGWTGLTFAGVGLFTAFLIMRRWGYPYDEVRRRSTAPAWMGRTHRGLGYVYILILVFMSYRMIPRLWLYPEEFSSIAALHAFLGVSLITVVLVKVAVVRAFPIFHKNLPAFGIPLLMLTLVTVSLVMAPPVFEWRLNRAVSPAADFGDGREMFFRLCTQCHGIRRVLSNVKTPSDWQATILRMSQKINAPEHQRIHENDQRKIIAYLTAIRGKSPESFDPGPAASGKEPPATESPAGGISPVAPETGSAENAKAAPGNDLERDAMAILSGRCAVCHSGAAAPKGVRLDSAASARSSAAVVPGDPASSELIRRIKGERTPRMPLNGPPYLSPGEIRTLEEWIGALKNGLQTSKGSESSTVASLKDPEPGATGPALAVPGPNEPVLFSHVQPIFMRACVKCHAANGIMGQPPEGLILSAWADVLRSSERPVVLPGHPQASLLIRHIRGLETPRMPFDGPPWLSEAETGLMHRWIEGGARESDGRKAPVPVGAKVRLRGQLQSRWMIDGAAFSVSEGTELRDIRIGGPAELTARVAADGRLAAERVRGR